MGFVPEAHGGDEGWRCPRDGLVGRAAWQRDGDAPGSRHMPAALPKKFLLLQEVGCLLQLWVK